MDVFSSALKNPLPPARKRSDQQKSELAETLNSLSEPSPYEPTSRTVSTYAPNGQTASQYGDQSQARDSKKKNLRRRHRNSHLGCGICKKRRIKCDEHLPECFNCLKGRLHCAYLNLDAPAQTALRLAQQNQSLRDEREEELSPKQEEKPRPYKDAPVGPRLHPPLYPSVINPPTDPVPAYANNPPTASSSGVSAANNPVPPKSMGPPVPMQAPLSMMHSMYVPVYQLQPMSSAMPYPQPPMQVMPGQQAQTIMYLPEQMPIQYASQHISGTTAPGMSAPSYACYPAPAHSFNHPYEGHPSSGYMMPMQGQYGPSAPRPESGAYYAYSAQTPEVMVSAPKSGILAISVPSQLVLVTHDSPSSSVTSVTGDKADALSATSLTRVVGHPAESSIPLASLLPASLGPSPLLPSMIGEPEISKNASIKLAPIGGKHDASRHDPSKHDPSEAESVTKETEKISSIKMLLS